MAQVWIQAWTAKVPGSVAVEQSVLAQVAGLENLLPLVPMLVKVEESRWELVPPHLMTAQELATAEEKLEVLPPHSESEMVSAQDLEKMKAKGWGWVLRLED
jgi:hypothetical protein